MSQNVLQFKDETFRDDFVYFNSPWAIDRFPFPFDKDSYMYAVNMEPHTNGRVGSVYEKSFDVDEHYVAEMRERALTLLEDPLRCQSLPHMTLAGWDLLELIMTHKARDYPDLFELHRDGLQWRWLNKPLGIEQSFTFGDEATLPYGPMEYITRQSQADWSLDFDIGMNFFEWHAPVPLAHELGIFQRALKFLLAIPQGAPARRLNWTMTVHPRHDTSPENYPKWGPDRTTVTPENVGDLMYLRVELQSFWRLPRSNALVFPIRCYLIQLNELVIHPKWAKRFHRVLRELPKELAEYKGFERNRSTMLKWLSQFDDGGLTSPGCGIN